MSRAWDAQEKFQTEDVCFLYFPDEDAHMIQNVSHREIDLAEEDVLRA